jgi:hypothetical protein
MIIPRIISILAPLFDVFHRIPQLHKTKSESIFFGSIIYDKHFVGNSWILYL